MAQNEIHVSDAGTVFQVTIQDSGSSVDISAATSTGLHFVFLSPTGTASTVTAAFLNTGSDGVLVYTTTSSTFGVIGEWKLQAIVELGTTTSKFHSDVYKFTVYPNL